MTVGVAMAAEPLHVSPGGAVSFWLDLVNDGPADQTRLVPRGPASSWVRLTADPVALGPGEHRRVMGTVEPPADAEPIGSLVPFAVQARAEGGSTVSSTSVIVVLAPRHAVSAFWENEGTSGRRRLTLTAVLRNDGTHDVTPRLSATCADDRLVVTVSPAEMQVVPGGIGRAVVVGRGRLRVWGAAREHQVSLGWTCDGSDGHETGTLEATFVQRALAGWPR